jgi:glyoxylase-like metal-dependent hydrolase (beta-lactamase superfamily II)
MIDLLAPNPSPITLSGTHTYLLGETHVMVIDPGPMIPEHLEAILNAIKGKKLAKILLTHHHPDHAGGARFLQEKTEAPILAYVHSPFSPALPINDGEKIDCNGIVLQAIHTPGHTRDHLCFFQKDEKALFTGDLVLGEGSTTINPPDGDLIAYMQSLEKIKNLGVEKIFPAHGPSPVLPKRIEEMIAHRKERHQQILKCIEQKITSPKEIVKRVYKEIPSALIPFAIKNVEAHLYAIQKGFFSL